MSALTSMLINKTERESKWIWMKGKSIRNTPPLNTPSLISLLHAFPPTPLPVIFYSLTRGEFNKYMQMCAVEHDECKSGEDVLWALLRLRLRADPGLIIFHFPIAFNSAAFAHMCVHVFVYICGLQCGTHVCASILAEAIHNYITNFVHMIRMIFTFKFVLNAMA